VIVATTIDSNITILNSTHRQMNEEHRARTDIIINIANNHLYVAKKNHDYDESLWFNGTVTVFSTTAGASRPIGAESVKLLC
jgi:hypothetical protein